eukprot:5981284-Amphidinium_carterae.1
MPHQILSSQSMRLALAFSSDASTTLNKEPRGKAKVFSGNTARCKHWFLVGACEFADVRSGGG